MPNRMDPSHCAACDALRDLSNNANEFLEVMSAFLTALGAAPVGDVCAVALCLPFLTALGAASPVLPLAGGMSTCDGRGVGVGMDGRFGRFGRFGRLAWNWVRFGHGRGWC